jgi:hypothetical protein
MCGIVPIGPQPCTLKGGSMITNDQKANWIWYIESNSTIDRIINTQLSGDEAVQIEKRCEDSVLRSLWRVSQPEMSSIKDGVCFVNRILTRLSKPTLPISIFVDRGTGVVSRYDALQASLPVIESFRTGEGPILLAS